MTIVRGGESGTGDVQAHIPVETTAAQLVDGLIAYGEFVRLRHDGTLSETHTQCDCKAELRRASSRAHRSDTHPRISRFCQSASVPSPVAVRHQRSPSGSTESQWTTPQPVTSRRNEPLQGLQYRLVATGSFSAYCEHSDFF